MAFSNFFSDLWSNIKKAPTFVPTYIEFTPEQTDDKDIQRFEKMDSNKHYFFVGVSEMFLSYKRKWHQGFSPMLFSVCGFLYDGKEIEIPYVIGPSLLKENQMKLPEGMLFLNTPVVGVHPWRGRDVSLSIILCRVKKTNYAKKLLNIVEKVSTSLNFSAALTNYTKIGHVLFDGIDALLGFEETSPVLGINNNYGQAAGNNLRPGYCALINEEDLDKSKFWVKDKRLHFGESLETAEPYRADDYVLYKIGVSTERYDEDYLSYYDSYKDLYEFIKHQTDLDKKQKENFKSKLRVLAVDIMTCPDLTSQQADLVYEEKINEIKKFIEKISKLKGGDQKVKELGFEDKIMNKAIDDLGL